MASPVRTAVKAIGAAFATVGRALGRGANGLTLVPQYLAGLLWLLSQKFEDLAASGYGRNAAAYACLRLLSQSVPEPPLLAYPIDATGELGEPLPWDHPLCRLIRQPNELMTEYEFWELATLHLGIIGRSVWWKERDRGGRIIGLWPLRPDRVGPIYSTSTNPGQHVISGYSYLIPGTVEYVPIPRADTFALNLPDPASDSGGVVEGLGPLQVLAAEVGADNEATKFVGSLLANYGAPGIVLTTSTTMTDEDDAKLLKAAFMREFSGNRRGVPAVLDADTKITQLGFNLKDLEFPNVRSISESRIAAAFGVPAILVGLQTGLMSGIRATISEQREHFAETTLSNYWRRFSTAFSNQVASEFGDSLACHFDLTKVKALQAQGRYETDKLATAFAQGAVTIDEYRVKVLELPPLEGGIGSALVIPTASAATPTTEAAPGADLDEPDTSRDDTAESVKRSRLRLLGGRRGKPALKAATDADKRAQAVRAGADRARQRGADHFAGPLYEYLHSLAAQLAERAARTSAVKALTVGDLAIPPEQTAKLRALLGQVWQGAMQTAYADAASILGQPGGLAFDPSGPGVKAVLGELDARAGAIDMTTRRAVGDVAASAVGGDLSVEQLVEAIRQDGAFSASRALTVALSESATAYNRALTLAYDDGGVTHVEVLDGMHDGPCADANGAVWTLEEADANPIAHPRCVRTFSPVINQSARGAAA